MARGSESRGSVNADNATRMPTLVADEFNPTTFEAHIRAYESHVARKAIDASWFSQTLDHDLREMLVSRFGLVFPADVEQEKDESNEDYIKRRNASTTKLMDQIRVQIAPKGVQAATKKVLDDCKWDPKSEHVGFMRLYAGAHEQRFIRYARGLDKAQQTAPELLKLYRECFSHVRRPNDTDEYSTSKILERLGESEGWKEWKAAANHVFMMCQSVDNNDQYLSLLGVLPLMKKERPMRERPDRARDERKTDKRDKAGPKTKAEKQAFLKAKREKYAEKHKDAVCDNCNKKGHIAPFCPKRAEEDDAPRRRPATPTRSESGNDSDASQKSARTLSEAFRARKEKTFRKGDRSSPRFAASAKKTSMSKDEVKAELKKVSDSKSLRDLVLMAYDDLGVQQPSEDESE